MNKVYLSIIAIITSIYSIDLTFVKFPSDYIPLIVYLKDFPDCDQKLKLSRDKCEYYYIKAVNETKLRLDINTESYVRAVCCESWQMKACIAEAAEDIPECGSEVAKRYVIMANHNVVMEGVLGKCSEYKENPPICDFAHKPATNLSFSIISFIMIFFFYYRHYYF
jgi:hypothetical protein